jgi:Cu/Ag efflux protein CusF
VLLAAGSVWLAGCVGTEALELGESHPANPRAAAASLAASAGLTAYRTPDDFAARLAADASTAPGPSHGAAHGSGGTQMAQGGQAAKPSGVGTLNGVNPDRRTVNLSHEPIPSVGWPAMTMDLPVAPTVDLRAVRPGSRVTFTLSRGADGFYVIDGIGPAPATGPGQPAGGGMPGMGHGGMGPGGMGPGGMGQGGAPAPGGGTAPPKGSQ